MLDILLVDDEADIRLPLGEALRELGHRVSLAADGDEAMQCLDRQIFNLVVSDIRLPKVDGFTILRRLRDEQPDTHVVLMTAFGTIQEAVLAVKARVSMEVLADTIHAFPTTARVMGGLFSQALDKLDASRP